MSLERVEGSKGALGLLKGRSVGFLWSLRPHMRALTLSVACMAAFGSLPKLLFLKWELVPQPEP